MDKDTLLELASYCETSQKEILAIVEGKDSIKLPEEMVAEKEEVVTHEGSDMYTLIGKMSVPEKVKLALFGNQTARRILIRDTSSKQIPFFVLQNARITEAEIYDIAKNSNIDEMVLRAIANNSHYMKNYAVKVAIVSNPRVPIDVSLKWVKFLVDKDLKKLASSKNIPQVLSTHCQKMLENKKKG